MFRKAALEAKRSQPLGDVIVAQPPSLKLATAFCMAAAAALLALFILGRYTQRSSVVGHLVPQSGIAKVSPPASGTVKAKHVADGQAVKAGDVLFVISGERRDGRGNATLATIIRQISARRDQLTHDISALEKSHHIEHRQWQKRLDTQSREIRKLDQLIAGHRRLVALAQANAHRYRKLHALEAVSKEQAQKAQTEFLEQQNRLHNLELDRLVAGREHSDTQETLASIPHKQQKERSQLGRQLATVSQELVENETAREFAVAAPISGTATAVVAQVGQHVASAKPLVSIVPNDQPLEAHLYVQSHAVGFLKHEAPVTLRYRAFPHQKFGLHKGSILSIAKTAVPHEEITDIDPYGASGNGPLYLVKVRLDRQWVYGAQGETLPLRAGMLLDAKVARETRHLYEWVLTPLYRIRETL